MSFLGTIDWINKMNWKDKEDWKASPRVAFSEGDHIEGYIKKSNNFALYWVERSGHMVMIKKGFYCINSHSLDSLYYL